MILNAATHRVKYIWMECDIDKHDHKSTAKVKRKVRLPMNSLRSKKRMICTEVKITNVVRFRDIATSKDFRNT